MSKSLYVLTSADCPVCKGEGKIETMTALTYDGAQSWRVERCPRCHGERVAMVPALCVFCKDEILETEYAMYKGNPCHKECLDEQ